MQFLRAAVPRALFTTMSRVNRNPEIKFTQVGNIVPITSIGVLFCDVVLGALYNAKLSQTLPNKY